jgi:hypothetical protein
MAPGIKICGINVCILALRIKICESKYVILKFFKIKITYVNSVNFNSGSQWNVKFESQKYKSNIPVSNKWLHMYGQESRRPCPLKQNHLYEDDDSE